jgi:hypothetical protein
VDSGLSHQYGFVEVTQVPKTLKAGEEENAEIAQSRWFIWVAVWSNSDHLLHHGDTLRHVANITELVNTLSQGNTEVQQRICIFQAVAPCIVICTDCLVQILNDMGCVPLLETDVAEHVQKPPPIAGGSRKE